MCISDRSILGLRGLVIQTELIQFGKFLPFAYSSNAYNSVERYRSPVSGSSATIVFPSFSGNRAKDVYKRQLYRIFEEIEPLLP